MPCNSGKAGGGTGGGASVSAGVMVVTGTATASTDCPSQVIKINTSAYNSATKTVVNPRFELQGFVAGNDTATPGATLNLLASTTSAGAVATDMTVSAGPRARPRC